MSYAFGGNQNLQFRLMTNQEMAETEGAVGPWGIIIGAATTTAGYLGNAASSGNFSWGWDGLLGAAASGAVMGAIPGVTISNPALYGYLAPRVSFAVGLLNGLAE